MTTLHVKSPNGNQYDIPLPIQIDSCPTGTVVSYAKNAAPTGWLLCDGSAVSRTTYAALFSVIGTTYGTGNGSTTFNLPNLVNRMVVGSGSSYAIAATGGEATHKLTVAELAQHDHTFTGSAVTSGTNSVGHTHSRGTMDITGFFDIRRSSYNWASSIVNNGGSFESDLTGATGVDSLEQTNIQAQCQRMSFTASRNWSGATSGQSANHTHSVTAAGTIGNNGSNTAHNNMPPYLAMRYIIKY